MQNRICAKITAILSVIAIIVSFASFSAAYAQDRLATLTLICRKENTILTGMKWRIYYIGTPSGNTLPLTGEFASYPVHVDLSSTDSISTAASTLENIAIIDNLTPLYSGRIDTEGNVVFSNLDSGYYMVSGDVFNIDEVFYQPTPALIEINTDEGQTDFNMVVYPKIKYALLSDMDLNQSVKKIWNDNRDFHEPIDVKLYKNSQLFDTVTLNEENQWTYNWQSEGYAQWRVMEANIPEHYTVNYQSDNGKHVIENFSDYVEETTVTNPPAKLPQTGQLWWPVIVLGIAGIVLIILGVRLKKHKTE